MSKRREERKKRRIEREKMEKNKKFSKVFFLYKKVSQTPFELLKEFKKSLIFQSWEKEAFEICQKRTGNRQGCAKIPLAYAGRLDPMAEGKMLILAGEACKDKDYYLCKDKEYVFEVLLGFSSDTGDVLGLVKLDTRRRFLTSEFNFWDRWKLKKTIDKNIKNMIGKRTMSYPHFSSKAVKGKPLFLWALEKKINQIKIPTKDVEIFSMKVLSVKKLKKEKMRENIFSRISSLQTVQEESKTLGEDFRRVKVLESWNRALEDVSQIERFLIVKIKTKVSSGTYMRTLAREIGEDLGATGLAYSIKRTNFFDIRCEYIRNF